MLLYIALEGPGSHGQVESSFLQKIELTKDAQDRYPLPLLKLMTRLAEDRVWANDVNMAQSVFTFVSELADRRDALDLRRCMSNG